MAIVPSLAVLKAVGPVSSGTTSVLPVASFFAEPAAVSTVVVISSAGNSGVTF